MALMALILVEMMTQVLDPDEFEILLWVAGIDTKNAFQV